MRPLYLHFDEESLEERLDKLRGYLSVNQNERIWVISKAALSLPSKKRRHFQGTNKGNAIGPVALPAFDSPDVWRVSQKLKKEIIGKSGGKIFVGGPLPGVPPAELKKITDAAVRSPNALEPVFYHANPGSLDEEIQHCYDLKAMFALTIGDGSLAMTSLRSRRPLFGICLSEAHKDALLQRLETLVWNAMCQEGDKLCEPGLIELMKTCGEQDVGDGDDQKPEPKKGSKRKPKAVDDTSDAPGGKKPKAKADAGTAAGSSTGAPSGKKPQTKEELLKKIAALTGNKANVDHADVEDTEEDADSHD